MPGYRSGLATGMALGIVTAMLSPLLWRWGRPAVKAAIRGGLDAYETGQEKFSELGEAVEDLVAEVRFERALERPAAAGEAAATERAAGGG